MPSLTCFFISFLNSLVKIGLLQTCVDLSKCHMDFFLLFIEEVEGESKKECEDKEEVHKEEEKQIEKSK